MKRYLSLLFVVLFPYYVVFELNCTLHGLERTVFQDQEGLFVLTFLSTLLAAQLTSVAVFLISYIMKWPLIDLLRANMILKLVHIPAYIAIFLFGFFSLITIFTAWISIIMIIMACITIFMSGLIGLAGVIRIAIEKKLSTKEVIIHSVLQFIFFGDIVSSIMIFKKIKSQV